MCQCYSDYLLEMSEDSSGVLTEEAMPKKNWAANRGENFNISVEKLE